MTLTEFTPVCEACQYDLTGLPDGRCPECGGAFTHADLHARWSRALTPTSYPIDRTHVLGTCSVLTFVCAWLNIVRPRYLADGILPEGFWEFLFWLMVSWALATFWCRAEKRLENPNLGAVSVWVSMLAYATWLTVHAVIRDGPFTAPLIATATVLALIIAFISPTRAETATVHTLRYCALAVLITGMAIAIDGLQEIASNIHWSRWPDPRASLHRRERPLTTREAAAFGAMLAAAGLMLLLGVEVLRRRWSCRRSAAPPNSPPFQLTRPRSRNSP